NHRPAFALRGPARWGAGRSAAPPRPDSSLGSARRQALLGPSIGEKKQRKPSGGEQVASQHVARPVRAQVHARDTDQDYWNGREDHRQAARARGTFSPQVGETEEKAEVRAIEHHVAGWKARIGQVMADSHQVRTRPGPGDERLGQLVEKRSDTGAQGQE